MAISVMLKLCWEVTNYWGTGEKERDALAGEDRNVVRRWYGLGFGDGFLCLKVHVDVSSYFVRGFIVYEIISVVCMAVDLFENQGDWTVGEDCLHFHF